MTARLRAMRTPGWARARAATSRCPAGRSRGDAAAGPAPTSSGTRSRAATAPGPKVSARSRSGSSRMTAVAGPLDRPDRPPRLARTEPDRAVALPADQRPERGDEVDGVLEGQVQLRHPGQSVTVSIWSRFLPKPPKTGIPCYGSLDVRRPKVVASAALIALLATVAVPGPVGSRAPSPFEPAAAALFADVEMAAVRGPVMTMMPLDPGARSAGSLDHASTMFEPAQRTEPPQARADAAVPETKADFDRQEPVALRRQHLVVRPWVLRPADRLRSGHDRVADRRRPQVPAMRHAHHLPLMAATS